MVVMPDNVTLNKRCEAVPSCIFPCALSIHQRCVTDMWRYCACKRRLRSNITTSPLVWDGQRYLTYCAFVMGLLWIWMQVVDLLPHSCSSVSAGQYFTREARKISEYSNFMSLRSYSKQSVFSPRRVRSRLEAARGQMLLLFNGHKEMDGGSCVLSGPWRRPDENSRHSREGEAKTYTNTLTSTHPMCYIFDLDKWIW